MVDGMRMEFQVLDLASSTGADVMITDPTVPAYIERGWDEANLIRECERAKRDKLSLIHI